MRSPKTTRQSESPWKTVAEGLVKYVPSGTYFAYYRQDSKPVRKSLKTNDLATAKRLLAKRRAEPARPRIPEISIGELARRYQQTQTRYSTSTQTLAKLFCDRIVGAVPDRLVSDFKGSDIEAVLNKRIEGGFSKSSYNEDLRNAKKMFTLAVLDGFLERTPIAHVKQLKRDEPLRDTPSEEEFEAIVEAIRMKKENRSFEDSADFVEFMGRAGVGNSEAAAMKWKDVDFTREEIRQSRNKTDKGYLIDIYPAIRPLLESLFKKSDKLPETKVFGISNARKALTNACKRLQLPHYTQRSLRRMFITKCIYQNVPVPTIGLWQGHSDNGATILKNYGQVIARKNKEFAQLIK